jgi:two-component system, NtrC family, sensor histidine kinase KinB
VIHNRQSALVNDTSHDSRWVRRPDDAAERSGAKSAICVPILAREKLVGVLTIVHATINSFNEEHLALIQSIADQAGIAVNNAQLYESLQGARQRYQELFEDSIDSILVTNLEGKIQEANRQAGALSKRSGEDLCEISIWEIQEQKAGWLENNLEAIHAGQTVRSESQLFPLHGSPLPIEFYVRKINFGGQDLLQWIIRDISERKQLDALRDDLNAMIYHDLRAPLANIVSSLDMLRTLTGNAEDEGQVIQQVLSIAFRSTERMQRLISSLLDISRLEAGQPIAIRKPVQVIPLLHEALESIQPVTSSKRQKVQLDVRGSLPDIWVDEDMIRRVLINLLENATKFTPMEGRISVGTETETRSDSLWVRFWVQDTGPGIPEAAQEFIFQKFSRLNIEHFPRGLGLGLAFCQLAVQAHGGKIGVESHMGSGSRFSFTVPTVQASTYKDTP